MADDEEGGGLIVSNAISGGVFFHAVIQGRDITVQLPPRVTPALSGLPAPSATVTGRDTHVKELLEGLVPGDGVRRGRCWWHPSRRGRRWRGPLGSARPNWSYRPPPGH